MLKNKIAFIGQPNVGKSSLINYLTGYKTMVSNYPGTTVEILEGTVVLDGKAYEFIDTPGTYSLHSDTEEQKVTQQVLVDRDVDLIVNVVDATNLKRNLYLTLQLMDFKIPMIMVLAQADRLEEKGLHLEEKVLAEKLGLPVIKVSSTRKTGLEEFKRAILSKGKIGKEFKFSEQVENYIKRIEAEIEREGIDSQRLLNHPLRTLAIHLLEHDQVDEYIMRRFPGVEKIVENIHQEIGDQGTHNSHSCFRNCATCPYYESGHPDFLTCLERTALANQIAAKVERQVRRPGENWLGKVENLLDKPFTGIPLMLGIVYIAFRFILGITGWTEGGIIQFVEWAKNLSLIQNIPIPEGMVWSILLKAVEEGIIIPFSVVMPAMLGVYLVISFLEDSGLLPRIAVTLDSLMKKMHFSGQTVIPLLLGFGCKVPAILGTRILSNPRERIKVIMLLSIVIPCASSLAIILSVVAKFNANVWVIVASIITMFLIMNFFLNRTMKLDIEDIISDIPPLRLPNFKNTAAKIWARLKSFFWEVLPIMFIASILIRALLEFDVLAPLQGLSFWTEQILGIRAEAFSGIVLTIFQRYLAPVVLLNLPLSAREATIACSMIAVSFPCLPVSVITIKEMNWKIFGQILLIAAVSSLLVGIGLNLILP